MTNTFAMNDILLIVSIANFMISGSFATHYYMLNDINVSIQRVAIFSLSN